LVPVLPPTPPLSPYTTLFRSHGRPGVPCGAHGLVHGARIRECDARGALAGELVADLQCRGGRAGYTRNVVRPVVSPGSHGGGSLDRKSTRLNSSHVKISYAVF